MTPPRPPTGRSCSSTSCIVRLVLPADAVPLLDLLRCACSSERAAARAAGVLDRRRRRDGRARVAHRGRGGLFAGLPAAMLRQATYGGPSFFAYPRARRARRAPAAAAPLWSKPRRALGGRRERAANPTDVVKVRLQADGRLAVRAPATSAGSSRPHTPRVAAPLSPLLLSARGAQLLGGERRYRGTADAFRLIWPRGARAFWKGCAPNVRAPRPSTASARGATIERRARRARRGRVARAVRCGDDGRRGDRARRRALRRRHTRLMNQNQRRVRGSARRARGARGARAVRALPVLPAGAVQRRQLRHHGAAPARLFGRSLTPTGGSLDVPVGRPGACCRRLLLASSSRGSTA